MHPIVVVLLDGLADRAHTSLGGRTANEVADTHNLDRLVAGGSNGVLFSLGPGRAPSSELAHWAILGYRPEEFPGRAVFEARGVGQEVDAEHVFAYAALRPADVRDSELWPAYVPEGVTQYIRLFSEWGGTKLDRMREAGYEVVVLDEGARKDVSGADVREALRDGGDWEGLVPPDVARVIRSLERVNA